MTTGYKFDVNEKINLEPSVMLKSTDVSPFHYDLNIKANSITSCGEDYHTEDKMH